MTLPIPRPDIEALLDALLDAAYWHETDQSDEKAREAYRTARAALLTEEGTSNA